MSRTETLKHIIDMWHSDRIAERSAALSFYAMISLVPLAVVGFGVAALFAGGGTFEPYILTFVENVFGAEAIPFFERIIESIREVRFNLAYSVIGLAILFYGASRLFVHLRRALADIFVIERSDGKGVERMVRERAVSFLYLILAFVLAFAFIALNVALSTSFEVIQGSFGLYIPKLVFHLVNSLVTLVVVACLYAVVYRVGSSFEVRWLFAFAGGMVASLFFLILNGIFSLYLHSSLFLSVFGASFFLVALLLWVYYGLQILFIGAEVADVYHRKE